MSSSISFRPTRRDLLLCLVTLSISYFLLSPSDTYGYDTLLKQGDPPYLDQINTNDISASESLPGAAGTGAGKGKYVPDWLWPGTLGRLTGSGSTSAVCDTSSSSSSSGGSEHGGIPREPTYAESVRTYGTSRQQQSYSEEGAVREGLKADWDQGSEDFGMADAPARGHEGMKTELLGHQAGWTLMDRVYIFNGSFYVVTENRDEWPELIRMTSTGVPANGDPGNAELRKPRGNEFIFISLDEAAELWGPRVQQMSGTTWMFNDGQFLDHYYHFSAELLLGAWRTYASLDPNISPTGETKLAPPRRAWFRHYDSKSWRDLPRFNPTVLFAAFPSISLLYPEDWEDLARITNSTLSAPRAFMLERCLFADRSSAFYGYLTAPTSRTVAGALWVGETTQWWWEPIRRQVLRYSGLSESIINRNLEGFGAIDPVHFGPPVNLPLAHAHPIGRNPWGDDWPSAKPIQEQGDYTPVVTYISRQSSRRRLTHESHEELVKALEAKRDEMGFELNVIEAEKLSREEQFALAGRTTIMIGVHGNGLTHLIWMPATPRSAVIEMYFMGGFARDYQWTAHALGMRHFGVGNYHNWTAPQLPEVEYPEGFHGTEIVVKGSLVADMVEDRLMGRI